MKKVIRLTESDLVRLVKKVINEQESPIDLGFKKWGDGFLIRLPKNSSSPKTDSIRIQATPSGDVYDVTVAVQGNKRVRSEIKGIKTFNEIENLLSDKFVKMDNVFDMVSGRVSMDILKKIYNKLSSLKIDEENNIFILTESDLVRVVKEQSETNTRLKNIDLTKFLDDYSNKLSNILKGKTFDTVTKNVKGEYNYPVIKFTGFADRNHTQDNQPIYKIKNFDFISSAIIVDPSGLPGFQKNQKVYVSFYLMFDNANFVKFGEITMYDESFKNSVKLFGWTPEDFGGVRNLNLQRQTPTKYA